jgi:hypothetical protein
MLRGFDSILEYKKWIKSQPKIEEPSLKDVVFAEIGLRTRITTSK